MQGSLLADLQSCGQHSSTATVRASRKTKLKTKNRKQQVVSEQQSSARSTGIPTSDAVNDNWRTFLKSLWLVAKPMGTSVKAVAVQSWGCLRLKEAGADNETAAVRARRHSASCLIPNQSSERRRAAVMRRPTKRLSHKSQMSRALQHKPPGRGRSVKTECKRGKVDFCSLARSLTLPFFPLNGCGCSPSLTARRHSSSATVFRTRGTVWSSWLQAGISLGEKKPTEGRSVYSERSR